MRLIFFLLIATLGLYSCNNDLTTIGQDLINNGNHIEVQTTLLKETGTIKIDSFITSSGRYGSAITEMFMGRYKDQYVVSRRHPPVFRSFRFPNRLSISGICWIRSPSISK